MIKKNNNLEKKDFISLKLFYEIWKFLSLRKRIQFLLIVLLMFASSLSEVLNLAIVVPFLSFLSDRSKIDSNFLVNNILIKNGISDQDNIFIFISLIFVAAIILSGSLRIINLYLSGKFTASIGHELSCESYRRSLYQELETHINRNSSFLITGITRHVDKTVALLNSLILLLISFLNVFFIYCGLLIINWKLAIFTAIGFFCIYSNLIFFTGKILRRNSINVADCSNRQLKELQEGFGSFREILLGGNQKIHIKNYAHIDKKMRNLTAQSLFIRSFPKFALESIAISLLVIIGLIIASESGDSNSLISSLGVLALASQRILPSAQNIYQSWAAIKSTSAEFSDVINLISQKINIYSDNIKPINISKKIIFKDVSFTYGKNQILIIKDLNLTILIGERIGIIGKTGSGKSTFIDLFMGLLKPTTGQIIINGYDINQSKNKLLLNNWRKSIAHVPQSIYLNDSSIRENIAFGIPFREIDDELVIFCAKKANLHLFISKLPNKYNTKVGELGIQLSGGQKQRIGIARALYKKSSILVLDEATSALDYSTEKKVINSINQSYKNKTIISIAHRTSTLESFDKILEFKNGRVYIIEKEK